ncbi:MAG: hypothetical protein ACI8UO_005532 [Verrucomicrobiales bacterium]|jgi:hypothetical protein
MPSQIFISAVPEEFGSYTDQLAAALRKRDFSVARQTDFEAGRGSLLGNLDAYLQRCDIVICLIGERYGAEPAYAESKEHGQGRYSLTQWEYLIARECGKTIHVFFPEPTALRDEDEPEKRSTRDRQAAFWAEEIEVKTVPREPFHNVDDVVKKVLAISGLEPNEEVRTVADPLARELDTECPYVGLRPFERSERLQFLTRDTLIRQLLRRIEFSPLTTVFGASGCGKSSILRAGALRDWAQEHGDNGKIIFTAPCADPYEGLVAGFARAGFDKDEVRAIAAPHIEDPDGAAGAVSSDVFHDLSRNLLEDGEKWLIVIDPFEEMFVRGQRAQRLLTERFVASIVSLIKEEPKDIRLVLTMRDDLFGLIQSHSELFPLIDSNLFRIPEILGDDLRQIIEEPAAKQGVIFERSLVDRIVDEVSDRPGLLPLMQHALMALWENSDVAGRMLTIDAHEANGGVEGALGRELDVFYEGLNEHEQRTVRNVLLTLVDICEPPRGARHVGKSATRDDIISIGGLELLQQLLDDAGILRATGPGGEIIEFAHEAVIDGWSRLKIWARDRREAMILRPLLQEDATRWETRRRKSEWAEARVVLWEGSRLAKVEELDANGDFQRVGGIGSLERRFLEACTRRKDNLDVIDLRKRLFESSERWKWLKRRRQWLKARGELWTGSDLERTVECWSGGQFKLLADFNDLGNLERLEKEFVRASVARRDRTMRRWRLRFWLIALVALFAIFAVSRPWTHQGLKRMGWDHPSLEKWFGWLDRQPVAAEVEAEPAAPDATD